MLEEIRNKPLRRVVGLMSGTSVDGIDAALVEIGGSDQAPEVRLLAFEDRPWPEGVREQIFPLFRPETATVDRIGYMNFLMGEIYAQAVVSVVEKAGLTLADIDLIGSHGQTIWHAPEPCDKDGFPVVFTVQIGEGSVIAARTGVPTVSDFRVADLAVGGQGAPLVPFSEYLLYRRSGKTILLQNIGGIGNMTVLPGDEGPEAVYAFDTGPGNMIIDAVVSALTGGEKTYDAGGAMAAQGKVDQNLLAVLQQDPYYTMPLPKTTGRERFGLQYVGKILDYGREHSLSDADLLATVTDLTAWSITDAYGRYVLPRRQATELVVGGGGSFNATLLGFLRERFAPYGVKVLTQEDLGWSSDAKEAVAFAIMADRCVREKPNVLPSVTGARQAAIMGKISLPPV
ncbi:anhydro-N-acetylmuramic acid kinase [Intestinimonas butyriciproducens]|uniref:anhydro-N-acetylmuramic acid kinase n=1 Tax=Intestinimonas butyriciproducens TaxID=1297617 RepID=UPI001958EF33|nr:anhydro-N-acetylmuramic acid kinase [Intestinimonas butyriciproducens]MBM6974292.1 anhydro-N-acetylmuramic acid kinase [Intestinimonas butyriciproducens]